MPDARQPLQAFAAQVVRKDFVDLGRSLRVDSMNDDQGIERNFVPPQQQGGAVDVLESRPTSIKPSEVVVQVLGAVDAQADVEAVYFEEFAPRFVEQHTAGLKIVFDAVAVGVFLLELDDLAEEFEAQ